MPKQSVPLLLETTVDLTTPHVYLVITLHLFQPTQLANQMLNNMSLSLESPV